MRVHTFSLIIGLIAFAVWLAIMYAGADHPRPWGFLWVGFVAAVAAGLAYLRIPVYLSWARSRRSWRRFRAAGEGLLLGLVFAVFVKLLPCSGEPSIQPTLLDQVLWLVVLSAVGAFNAIAVYAVSSAVRRWVQDS